MADTYYGQSAGSTDTKTIQERCREYYSISDFVVVMNIDTKPFSYQVQRPEHMEYDQPDAVSMNTRMVQPPERITLQPGETRLCPAYEADLMIKNLIDKMVYRNRKFLLDEAKNKGEENVTLREAVMDPETQHKYISEIYQGKKDFMSEYNQSTPKVDVSKDLEDDVTTPAEIVRGPGRPKKQIA